MVLVVANTFACHRSPAPAEAKETALEATFGGCAAVTAEDRGIVCELGEARELKLVVSRAALDVTIEVETSAKGKSTPIASRSEVSLDSVRHTVDVPVSAGQITVRATVKGERSAFRLTVRDAASPPWLGEAKALRSSGELPRARALAVAHLEDGPSTCALAKSLLARISLAEGHSEDAFVLFRAAIALHRSARRLSDVVDDSFALAFALHQRSHRYDEARATLDALSTELLLYPEGQAREPYYRGILASETGNRRGARVWLQEAEKRAHTLGMNRLERHAQAALALEMQVLGHARESLERLRGLERLPEVTGCERVEVANDLGWGALLANESTGDLREDARGPLERAVAAQDCGDVNVKGFAFGNLARLALREGDSSGAQTYLDRARALVTEPRGSERLAWLDLDGQILLSRHLPHAALARFDEELTKANSNAALEAVWSAHLGRARALEALGRRADVVDSLLKAEAVVDRAMLLVPLGEGRGVFVSDHDRSARWVIEHLVTVGRTTEAASVARRSSMRVLGSVARALRIERLPPTERSRWENAVQSYRASREELEAQATTNWKLPTDARGRSAANRKDRESTLRGLLEAAMAELTTNTNDNAETEVAARGHPPPGDLEVLVHPGKTGWFAIAVDASRATAHRIPDPEGVSLQDLARALLDPIASRIAEAKRVRVRAYGAWRRVDIHAMPFHGAPLLASVTVDYPLGLGTRYPLGLGTRPAAVRTESQALIIGDPTSDLEAARGEAERVAIEVRRRMRVTTLLGSEATSRGTLARLARVDLLHYAGHGVFAGAEGWESTLPLADGASLSIGDLLALPRAPLKVVLTGCDAARSAGGAEGLGLAQALVVSGSEEVLAPTRPVSDVLGAALAGALYSGSNGDVTCAFGDPGSLARATRIALEALRARDPAADWSAFRVLAR